MSDNKTGSTVNRDGGEGHIEVEVESMEVFRQKYEFGSILRRTLTQRKNEESSAGTIKVEFDSIYHPRPISRRQHFTLTTDCTASSTDVKHEPEEDVIIYQDEDTDDDYQYVDATEELDTQTSSHNITDNNLHTFPGTSQMEWSLPTEENEDLDSAAVYVDEYYQDDQTTFQCSDCLKTFSTFHSLKQHRVVHSSEKPFKCDECGKTFARKGDLQRHKTIHTGIKPYQCNICCKTFRESSKLKNHLVSHSGEKAYECSICLKKFTLSTNLMKHKLIHTGEKPFECDICLRRFRQLSCLATHKFLHSGEKPFQCEVCMQRFTQSSSLMKHKMTHSGEKPYECKICLRRFRQTSSLRVHVLTHSGERPFQCGVCFKSFRQSSNLSRHMTSHKDAGDDDATDDASTR